jgi:hypothetical protein
VDLLQCANERYTIGCAKQHGNHAAISVRNVHHKEQGRAPSQNTTRATSAAVTCDPMCDFSMKIRNHLFMQLQDYAFLIAKNIVHGIYSIH